MRTTAAITCKLHRQIVADAIIACDIEAVIPKVLEAIEPLYNKKVVRKDGSTTAKFKELVSLAIKPYLGTSKHIYTYNEYSSIAVEFKYRIIFGQNITSAGETSSDDAEYYSQTLLIANTEDGILIKKDDALSSMVKRVESLKAVDYVYVKHQLNEIEKLAKRISEIRNTIPHYAR